MVQLSHSCYPLGGGPADETDIPYGCVIKPFLSGDGSADGLDALPSAVRIARCSSCFAYINCFASVGRVQWKCSLCQNMNGFSRRDSRYMASSLSSLRELTSDSFECEMDLDVPLAGAAASENSAGSGPLDVRAAPERYTALDKPVVHVLCISEQGSLGYIEAISDALMQLVDHMHDQLHVLLVTMSSRIGVLHLRSHHPTIYFTTIGGADGQSGATSPALADVLPFGTAFVTVGTCREQVKAALRGLLDVLGTQTHDIAAGAVEPTDKSPADMIQGLAALMDWMLPASQVAAAAEESLLTSTINAFRSMFISTPQPSQRLEGLRQETVTTADCAAVVVHLFLEAQYESSSVPPAAEDLARNVGRRAAEEGVTFHIWAFDDSALHVAPRTLCCALPALAPFTQLTNGRIEVYSLQDVHNSASRFTAQLLRTVLAPTAYKCLLRVRATPHTHAAIMHPLPHDGQIDGLMRLGSCAENDAVGCTFTLQHSSSSKSDDFVLQIAFAYTALVEVPERTPQRQQQEAASEQTGGVASSNQANWREVWMQYVTATEKLAGSVGVRRSEKSPPSSQGIRPRPSTGSRARSTLVVVRKLRVVTMQLPLNLGKLTPSVKVNVPAALSLVARDAVQGLLSGSSRVDVLFHWLKDHFQLSKISSNDKSLLLRGEHVSSVIARFVFGLMQKQLCRMDSTSPAGQDRAMVEASYLAHADPVSTMKFVYPEMLAVSSSVGLEHPPLQLRRERLVILGSSAIAYFVDAGEEMLIFHPQVSGAIESADEENLARIRKAVHKAIVTRMLSSPVIPILRVCYAGTTEATHLQKHLVEDQLLARNNDSFPKFLDRLCGVDPGEHSQSSHQQFQHRQSV